MGRWGVARLSCVLRFYGRLLRRTPVLLFVATDRVVTFVAVVLTLMVATNREWAGWLELTWATISPTWALLPIGLVLLYGLLRANYEEHQKAVERGTAASELQSILRVGRELRSVIAKLPARQARVASNEWAERLYQVLKRERPALLPLLNDAVSASRAELDAHKSADLLLGCVEEIERAVE